jgi:hypothetical protein
MKVATQKFSWKDLLAYGLFWSWNLIFLAFMVLGFAPRLLPDLLLSVREGMIPFEYLIYGLVLSIIPVISIVLGLTVLRGAPTRAFALGYVVEGPLMLLLTVRFFLIRQATPGVMMLMGTAILGMAAFLWQLLDPKIERRGRLASTLRLAGLTLMLLTSLYAALWIAFYALPISASALEWWNKTLGNLTYFFSNFWASIKDLLRERIEWVFFSILGFLLLLYTATLFVLAPIAIPILSARAWWCSLKSLAKRSS